MSNQVPDLLLFEVTPSTESVSISLQLSDSREAPSRANLEAAIRAFVLAGAAHGYPASTAAPAHSSMSLGGVEFGATQVSCALKLSQVDPHAYQLLRNMIGRLNHERATCSRICVVNLARSGSQPSSVPEIFEENELESYPKVSPQIAFDTAKEESGFGKVRRCLVEMRQPPSAEQVLALSDYTKPWYEILEAGAFALPIGPPGEIEAIGGTVTQFDEVTVEIVVSRFLASECAWDVLLNMLDAYSCTSFPLAKVTID